MEYVLVVLSRRWEGEQEIVLVLKDRPEWQKGRYNLPGGKIEKGETPIEAAKREVREETGLEGNRFLPVGIIKDDDRTIHVFFAHINYFQKFNPRLGETEVPAWVSVSNALTSPQLIPNLKVVIPMALSGVTDWTITDSNDSLTLTGRNHTFTITV